MASDFRNLFKSLNHGSFSDYFQDFAPKLTHRMNVSLLRRVSHEEVGDAVFSINPSSAPVSDGMNGMFFQHYWSIIGNGVTKEVRYFFETGVFPKE